MKFIVGLVIGVVMITIGVTALSLGFKLATLLASGIITLFSPELLPIVGLIGSLGLAFFILPSLMSLMRHSPDISSSLQNFWSSIKRGVNNFFNPQNKALLNACYEFNLPDMQKALEKGANVNCVDDAGNTPLLILLSKNKSKNFKNSLIKMIQILAAKGADPAICNRSGFNTLYMIINNNLTDVIPLFKGKNIFNSPISLSSQQTPLMEAVIKFCAFATNESLKIVEELISCGADPNIKSGYGEKMTPFVYALRNLAGGVISDIKQKLCEFLLDKGANPCASLERINTRTGETVREDFFLNLPQAQIATIKPLYDRCLSIIEKHQATFSLPEGIAQSKDEKLIDKTIAEAIHFQSAGDDKVIEKLTNVFIQESNTIAIEAMVKLLKPTTTGYAAFHHRLATAYSEEAKGSIEAELSDFRKLTIKHCLAGLQSQEETVQAKAELKGLQEFLKFCLADWKKEMPTTNDTDDLDINDEVANALVNGTQAMAQLFELKKAQSSSPAQAVGTASVRLQ